MPLRTALSVARQLQAGWSAGFWQQGLQGGLQGGEQHLHRLPLIEIGSAHLLDPLQAEPLDAIEQGLMPVHPLHQPIGADLLRRRQQVHDVADPVLIKVGEPAIGAKAGTSLREDGSWLHHWGAPGGSIPPVAPLSRSVSPRRGSRSLIHGCDAGFGFRPGLCCWWPYSESSEDERACGIGSPSPSAITLCSPRR